LIPSVQSAGNAFAGARDSRSYALVVKFHQREYNAVYDGNAQKASAHRWGHMGQIDPQSAFV
jgi:hypothetical protein